MKEVWEVQMASEQNGSYMTYISMVSKVKSLLKSDKRMMKVICVRERMSELYSRLKSIDMKSTYTLSAFLILSGALQAQICNNYWAEISPDGNTLYFSSDRHGGDYEIYRSDLDGISNLERLTTLAGHDYKPRISPDGNKIVFQNGGYYSEAEIYIMDIDGSNLVQLTDNSVYDGSPSFSPDGETIIFSAWDGSQYPEIFTMNVDGSDRTQLTNVSGAYWQSDGVFNPAGDKIYFLEGFNADNHIVSMDLDGSNWMDITPSNFFWLRRGQHRF
ncbi:MAG: TolB family protein [Bacteroidota bacterium]